MDVLKKITMIDGKVTLYQGDCLEIMPTLEGIDVVITDPPYGLSVKYESYEDTPDNLKVLINGFVPEARRIARLVVVYCGVHNIQIYPQADWVGCWFYGTTGSFGKFGYNAWQPYLLYGKNNNRYGLDTIKYSKMEKRAEGHPCSKPLGLMEATIKRFTNPSDTILDPFMGSGTTGVACVRTGRNFIGIEIDEGYFNIAKKRIEQENQQIRLFY